MELNIGFKNPKTSNLYFKSKNSKNKTFVLKVKDGGKLSQKECVNRLLQEIAYAFAGVKNNASQEIEMLNIRDSSLKQEIFKSNNNAMGRQNTMEFKDRYGYIVLDVSSGVVTENVYLTRNGIEEILEKTRKISDINQISLKYENLNINTSFLINENPEKFKSMAGLLFASKYIQEYIGKPYLTYNKESNTMELMDINSIQDDDVYTFFKLYSLLRDKNKPIGTIFINAEKFKPEVLKAIANMVTMRYKKDILVFFYNTEGIRLDIKKETITIPNYLNVEEER